MHLILILPCRNRLLAPHHLFLPLPYFTEGILHEKQFCMLAMSSTISDIPGKIQQRSINPQKERRTTAKETSTMMPTTGA